MISPKATIHPTAQIGSNVRIEAFVSIGSGVRVGDGSIISAFSYIHNSCVLENDVFIGSHCHIGSDGFGYAQNKKGESFFTPQIGIVRLKEGCKILDHCCIDRAAFGETVIGKNTVLGGHSHIAHNLVVGDSSVIAPGFVVAGSTKIGQQVQFGERVNCVGHINICDKVVCEPMALINKSISEPGHYAGTLLKKLSDWKEIAIGIKESSKWQSL